MARNWLRPAGASLARAGRAALTTGRGLALIAATVAVVATAVVLVAVSGGPGQAAGKTRAVRPKVVQPVAVSAAQLARLPQATTFTTTPAAPLDPSPFSLTNGLVLHPLTAQVLYAAPGKAPVAVLPATELGAPTWVLVVQTTPGWDRVLLPSRPNHASGWIFTGGADASRVQVRISPYLIRVQLGARKLSIIDNGRSLGTWTVAVGAPGTPTPTGRTFVLALLEPTDPTYSPYILPLGFHSNTLTTYGGGPGTVGLHGWPEPSVFGQAVSHGCVRVPPAALQLLTKVPLGSQVLITS